MITYYFSKSIILDSPWERVRGEVAPALTKMINFHQIKVTRPSYLYEVAPASTKIINFHQMKVAQHSYRYDKTNSRNTWYH